MILSIVTWIDADENEYMTCENNVDKKEFWEIIDKARKLKPKHEITSIDFYKIAGNHYDK